MLSPKKPQENPEIDTLTSRELEILEALRDGSSSKKISKKIGDISVQTINVHLHRIMQKLNVHTRADLISLANKGQPETVRKNLSEKLKTNPSYRLSSHNKNQLLLGITILMGFLSIGYIILKQFYFFSHPLRFEFHMPAQCLQRENFLKAIDRLYRNDKNPIKIVALTGMPGMGKTTLARQYGQKVKANIIWEINAESKETLLHSFSFLAYALCKTQEEKLELDCIKKIENQQEYTHNLIYFIKQKLKQKKNWFLIFDNVETVESLHEFFPVDALVWGIGKILITTHNNNIKDQGLIKVSQVISIGELTSEEKINLFSKIHKQPEKNKTELKYFLEKLPPFPLDISIAAYHIKSTKNSYKEYSQRLQNQSKNDKNIVAPPHDMSGYNKTRQNIIGNVVEQVLTKRPEFSGLLLLTCLIDSQNIPKNLLVQYCDPVIVDDFIQTMEQFSLLTYQENKNNQIATLSIHRSVQKNILELLSSNIPLQTGEKLLDQVINALEKYCLSIIEKIDVEQMQTLIRHLKVALNKKDIIKNFNKNILQFLLGIIYCEMSDPVTAKYYLEPSYSGFLSYYKNNSHPRLLRIIDALGFSEHLMGNYPKAKELLEKVIMMHQNARSINFPEYTRALRYLGCVYRATDEFEKAKDVIKKAIVIYEKHYENNLALALTFADLGSIDFYTGHYKQSIEYCSKSLQILQKTYHPSYVKNLSITSLLGRSYKALGQYDKAIIALQKSHAGLQKHHTYNFDLLSIAAIRLGTLYRTLGLYKEADFFLQQGLNLLKKHFGDHHINADGAKIEIYQLYMEQGKFDMPAHGLEEILKNQIYRCGENHTKNINVFHQLGIAHTYLGNYQQAQIYFEKSLELCRKKYGENHIEYALILQDYARFWIKTNHFSQAESILKTALHLLRKANHPEQYQCLEKLGDLYVQHHLATQAKDYYNKALNVLDMYYPKESMHLSRVKKKLNARLQ
jgi:tetratricopeptide (TPR) repeat protein/DNA-binding CsgD family transcriptional regulator